MHPISHTHNTCDVLINELVFGSVYDDYLHIVYMVGIAPIGPRYIVEKMLKMKYFIPILWLE